MPITHRYDPQKEALYGEMKGEFTSEEYRSALSAIASSTSHSPSIRSIWDLRELDFTKVTPQLVRACVEVRSSFPKRHPAKIAFVVDDDLGFGMTRMFEIVGDQLGDATKVFREFFDAELWLLQEQPEVS